MRKDAAFENILHDVHELETFLHSVIGPLAKQKLKTGEDIRPHIVKMGLKVPASLEGLPITWGGEDIDGAKGEQQTIRWFVRVRPKRSASRSDASESKASGFASNADGCTAAL